jgi:divalent metal cation (Fe/Co/Zn/Cd) transporter
MKKFVLLVVSCFLLVAGSAAFIYTIYPFLNQHKFELLGGVNSLGRLLVGIISSVVMLLGAFFIDRMRKN